MRDAGSAARSFLSRLGPATARGEYADALDSDGDGLPDEFERFSRTDDWNPDSDGDGFVDGIEWVLGSDPNDATSLPEVRPAVRSYAYFCGSKVRVFAAAYPADSEVVDSMHFLAGSPNFTTAPEGDPGSGVGIFDLTGALPDLVVDYTSTPLYGLTFVGLDLDFDRALLEESAPVSLSLAGSISGTTVTDQLYLSFQGATGYVMSLGTGAFGAAGAMAIHPLDPFPPPDDESPEYCAVGLSDGTPVGVGSLEYSVVSATCAPSGLLYCIDADCTALAGQTFTMIDYGYLQSKAAE